MIITWYGEGCFKIQTGNIQILSDPFESSSGLTPPRLKADILLKTINSLPLKEEREEGVCVVSGAGEYNLRGINIRGFPLPKESTEKFLKIIYLLEAEDIKTVFLGHISELPEPTVLEHIEGVDILFIPGGGKPFVDHKSALKIVKHLQPKIVIPSFFKIPGLKRQTADIKTFLEELNNKKVEPQEKLTIKKKDLSAIKSIDVVILKK